MSTTTLNGSVVNSPVSARRAIAADSIDVLTLLPYSHERSLAVDWALWIEDQSFEVLARFVLEGGRV
ncbi:hypothetical protein NDI52_33675 [Leptolyngbya sp. PL-A3]|uniref:hypothetical protein n=1 Tax=Leptolyngbya sp. PL-A3 TaxID=2933911 RepID=UPI0032991FF2